MAANIEALQLLRQLQTQARSASTAEQAVLARWSGWGALPAVFDEANLQFADGRTKLRSLLDEHNWRAASKTTLNAHYTDAGIATAMWDAVAGGLPLRAGERDEAADQHHQHADDDASSTRPSGRCC